MKLRLTQAGFENYTGQMGVVMFENGLSVGDVLPIDAVRISAAIGADWEDGSAANVGAMYLNSMDVPAYVGRSDNDLSVPVAPVDKVQPAAADGAAHTKDDLAKIADTDGIAGLRAIAEPMGVKGTSIVGLIEAILKKQGSME